MKDLKVTYARDTLPFIQTSPGALYLNTYYCRNITPSFLKGIIIDLGYDDITDVIVEQIISFSRIYNEEEEITVVFPLKEKSGE
jgi:hypothetical protein